MKERANEILNANNEIAFLQDKLEATESTTYRLQNEVDSTIRGMSDKTLELCQITNRNVMFRPRKKLLVNQWQNPPRIWSAECCVYSMDRLDEICAYMTDYNDICAEYDKWSSKLVNRPETS
mmetsp:Transcript_31872/g.105486  ORF Transcript_31872/g.105486 Transcript_31872/m.105486 type:complete len:122 (+) Transcript_31872:828-1193(+)